MPTNFVVVICHEVGRTVAAKTVIVSIFAGCPVREATGELGRKYMPPQPDPTTEKATCFVVMGFGKKNDFETGRVLDLDPSGEETQFRFQQ